MKIAVLQIKIIIIMWNDLLFKWNLLIPSILDNIQEDEIISLKIMIEEEENIHSGQFIKQKDVSILVINRNDYCKH